MIGSSNICGSSFSSLPRSLTYLDIFLENVNDSDIANLLSNLKTLKFSDGKTLTGKCFARLPRSLTLLELQLLSSIEDSDIGDLPRTLTSLTLNEAETLSDACGPLLPPNLKDFIITGEPTSPTPAIVHYMSKVGQAELRTAYFVITRMDGKITSAWG